MSYSMDGYVDVAERIRQLREKHPEAVLRPYNPAEPFKIMEIGGREFIVYVAACYRTPDDPMPAVAVAAEPAIGRTNFTRDSEVMNAETSAWGRAIVACLAADTQRIASLNEVQNRKSDQQADESRAAHPTALKVVRDSQQEAESVAKAFNGHVVQRPAQSGAQSSSGITPQQSKMIHARLAQRGISEGESGELLSMVLKRTISSVSELSKRDASSVIDFLLNGDKS